MAENKEANMEIDLYSMNKQLMAQMPKLDDIGRNKAMLSFKDYFNRQKATYFMLLNHETRDYTVFHFTEMSYAKMAQAADILMECLDNRGNLKSVQFTSDKIALEIWVDEFVYYFFPYDDGVITI